MLLFVLNLTVAVGTLNGIIFYAHIVAANSKILFPFSEPNFATVIVSWLNMELGVDACFFQGMDAYWKSWLQLAFPTYVIFLVVLVIIVSEHSIRFAHLIGKRNPMAVLTTLILLSYAKLLHTIIAAFSFATLEYPNGSQHTLWLPDATVGYFSGKHIALFIAAVFIFMTGVVYTILLFSWQWLLRYQEKPILCWVRNQKLCQFLEPYHAPYTFGQRYWTGLLLLIRVMLYIVSAINVSGNPRLALVSTITLVGFLPLLKGFLAIRVYKIVPIDIIEMTVYFNLMMLSAFSWYSLETDQLTRAAVAYTSASITSVLLVAVLFYHIHKYTNVFSKLRDSIDFQGIKFRYQRKQPHNQAECDNGLKGNEVLEIREKITFSTVEVKKPEIQNLESEVNNDGPTPIPDGELF